MGKLSKMSGDLDMYTQNTVKGTKMFVGGIIFAVSLKVDNTCDDQQQLPYWVNAVSFHIFAVTLLDVMAQKFRRFREGSIERSCDERTKLWAPSWTTSGASFTSHSPSVWCLGPPGHTGRSALAARQRSSQAFFSSSSSGNGCCSNSSTTSHF